VRVFRDVNKEGVGTILGAVAH